MVTACTLAVVVSAAPAVPASNSNVIAALTKNCPELKVTDHGDWAEAICDRQTEHSLEKREAPHFFSFQQGESYVTVFEVGTISRNIVLYGKTWESIVDQPKRCTKDGDFCFDIWQDTCEYFYANRGKEKYCSNFSSVDLYF